MSDLMIHEDYKMSVLMSLGFWSAGSEETEGDTQTWDHVELWFQDKGQEGKSFSGAFHPRHRYRCRNQVTQHTFPSEQDRSQQVGEVSEKKLMRCKVKSGITRNILITFGCVIPHALPVFCLFVYFLCQFVQYRLLTKEINKQMLYQIQKSLYIRTWRQVHLLS